MRRMIGSWTITLLLLGFGAQAEEVALPGLQAPVQVYYDEYRVPHVFGETWPDVSMVLGYLHAGERLWEMDLLRRTASGRLAEVLGAGQLKMDKEMRMLRIRATSQAYWDSGEVPEGFRADLEAYAAGVNSRIQELGAEGLPALFQALGYAPEPWSPVDSIAFMKYMGWDQGGTYDDLWFGAMVEKLGVDAMEALWPLERPYEIPTVRTQTERPLASAALTPPVADAVGAFAAAFLARDDDGILGKGGQSYGSNNWAVSGAKTKSGKPILCSDPHLGFRLPSLWYMAHLSAGGRSVAGATFPTGPYVIIGHTDSIAWGITNMQADAVDYFVETVSPDDPAQYLHRGEWKTMERVTERFKVQGGDEVEEVFDYTVHGPVIAREGKVIAMQWAGLGSTKDGLGIWQLRDAANHTEALAAFDNIAVPALNMAYADIHGTVMIHPCGSLPVRPRGYGRIPMDGASGDYDWQGFLPRRALPLSVNPVNEFIASANGRPQPLGFPHYLGWMWDVSYRTRRLNEILEGADGLDIEAMKRIQYDHHDKAAERFLPVFLAAMQRATTDLDEFGQGLLDILAAWDYVASVDSRAPLVWLTWLGEYRSGVWNDEWTARNIEQTGGSWGFSGTNRREPILEVLEQMTHEQPNSPWFDDRTTPGAVETRDDIIVAAFARTAQALQKRLGGDLAQLEWGTMNRLKIDSWSGMPELAREGDASPGDSFTLNPGGDGGTVGGGASFRLIVDFGDTTKSVAVIPGGQSGDPASAQYHDQMALWAAGQYVPLHAVGDPAQLPEAIRAHGERFVPKS